MHIGNQSGLEIPQLAEYVKNLTGGLDQKTIGIGANQREIEGLFLAFSPKLLRSTVALFSDAFRYFQIFSDIFHTSKCPSMKYSGGKNPFFKPNHNWTFDPNSFSSNEFVNNLQSMKLVCNIWKLISPSM